MRWIWLCAALLILNNLHKTNGDDLDLGKGLIFKERGEVLATATTWRIQIPMNTKIFTTALADLKSNLDGYVQNLERSGMEATADWMVKSPVFSEMRFASYQLTHRIGDIFSAIKHLITKRHVTQNTHHFHFNTTAEILNIMSEEVTIYNATNNHLSLLKTEVYSQLQQVMDNIKIPQENSPNPAGRSRQVRQVSDEMEAFKGAFDFLGAEVTSLKQAYKLAKKGKLDPFFLPPSILVKILNQIDAERGLLFPDEMGQRTTLRNFYNLAKVRVLSGADSSELVLDVSFPVLDKRSRFTVFEPVPLPARLVAKGLFFQINPEADLIAVDQERKRYFLMSFSEFCTCQNSTSKVCYPQRPIRREDEEPSCLMRLLKTAVTDAEGLCDVAIIKTFKPRFIKPTPFSDYIYAVPSDTKLDKKCGWGAMVMEMPDSISGTGTLYVPSSCTVSVAGYLLDGINIKTDNEPDFGKIGLRERFGQLVESDKRC